MSAWKPGDVALVNTGDEDGVAVVRHHHDDPAAVFVFADHHFYKSIAVNNNVLIKSARPLVVIDPEDREQVARLAHALGREEAVYARPSDVTLHYNPDLMQAALRSFLAPPKPDEPTAKYAVVEDVNGEDWVRVLGSDFVDGWVRAGSLPSGGEWTHYSDIAAVRVLSEGLGDQ